MRYEALMDSYGSPLYVYDLHVLRAQVRSLIESLPSRSGLLYSLKANPNPRLVSECQQLGLGGEVSSIRELKIAVACDIPAECLLYSGPGKNAAELAAAIRGGARFFSIESLSQLAALEATAVTTGETVRALLRINPSEFGGAVAIAMGGRPSQFGMDPEGLVAGRRALKSLEACQVVGAHYYLGTNVLSVQDLILQFAAVIRSALVVSSALELDLQVLDVGGGFGAPYAAGGEPVDLSELRVALEEELSSSFPNWQQGTPQIVFESGRYIVGPAGVLLATVVDVKRSQGRQFVVLDAGINHLAGMSALGRLPRIRPELISLNQSDQSDVHAVETDVVGPLCTPLDWWARDTPGSFAIGDQIVVPNVGAYGLTASLVAFLSRACPAEIVVDGDTVEDASILVCDRRALDRHAGIVTV